MKQRITLALCVLQLSFAAIADPQTNLVDRLEKMQSVSADFSQQVSTDEGELLQHSSGEMVVAKPNRVYWSTKAPFQHKVITDGHTLWVYDADLEQLTQSPFDPATAATPALLLSGDAEAITEQFTVEQQAAHHFKLLAKDKASSFSTIEFVFTGDRLQEMLLRDQFGQRTKIEFQQLQLNQIIDEALFRFEAPVGTDIIINE
jgi:outer membrane lipoprotein carrier protein